jgi:hypothetical protein
MKYIWLICGTVCSFSWIISIVLKDDFFSLKFMIATLFSIVMIHLLDLEEKIDKKELKHFVN